MNTKKYAISALVLALLLLSGYAIYAKKIPSLHCIVDRVCEIDPLSRDDIVIRPITGTTTIFDDGYQITIADNQLLVSLRDGYSTEELTTFLSSLPDLGISVIGQIPGIRLFQVELENAERLDEVKLALEEMPSVVKVEYNEANTTTFPFDD